VTTIHAIKSQTGHLVPADDESAEAIRKFKAGNVVRLEAHQMRNGKFFRKFWALAKVAYDLWTETAEMPEYKGEPVQPSFDRFRRDLTILAGHYKVVVNIRGETRLEADSLAWSKMSEDDFEKLYSATINAVLQKVLRAGLVDEAKLRQMVDSVLEFA
jgi:hypothetical protein